MAEQNDEKEQNKNSVHRSVKNVMGIPTVISSIGNLTENNVCAIFIPGNPGVIEFYDVFLERLYERSGKRLPIIGIAQGGHSPAWKYTDHELGNVDEQMDLQTQVDHKIEFVLENIPRDMQIVFIGHSIGAYILLKMLSVREIANQVFHTVLIHPVIERMAVTPKGLYMQPFCNYFGLPAALLAWSLSLLPVFMKKLMVAMIYGNSLDESIFNAIDSFINFSTLKNAIYMAKTEMEDLLDLEGSMGDVITEHENRLTLYYSPTDDWAPIEYYEDMKTRFPNSDIRLCNLGMKHAFVLTSSVLMADTIYGILKERNLELEYSLD